MDLRQLRYFVTIVQTGSMAAAAKQLHLAQPALSHHLKNLEREFDTRLLERGPKGMSATAKGELLYQHAVALLRQAGNIESAMLHGTAPAAVVSLGLPKTVARLLAFPVFARMKKSHPAIQLQITEGYSSELGRAAVESRLDLAVVVSPAPSSGARVMELLTEQLFVVVPVKAQAWLPASRQLTVAQLSALPLLMTTRRERVHSLMLSMLADNHGALSVQGHIDSPDSLLKAVSEGFGVTILPSSAVQDAVESGRVAVRSVKGTPMARKLMLVRADGADMQPAPLRVAEVILELIAEMSRAGGWTGTKLSANDISRFR